MVQNENKVGNTNSKVSKWGQPCNCTLTIQPFAELHYTCVCKENNFKVQLSLDYTKEYTYLVYMRVPLKTNLHMPSLCFQANILGVIGRHSFKSLTRSCRKCRIIMTGESSLQVISSYLKSVLVLFLKVHYIIGAALNWKYGRWTLFNKYGFWQSDNCKDIHGILHDNRNQIKTR